MNREFILCLCLLLSLPGCSQPRKKAAQKQPPKYHAAAKAAPKLVQWTKVRADRAVAHDPKAIYEIPNRFITVAMLNHLYKIGFLHCNDYETMVDPNYHGHNPKLWTPYLAQTLWEKCGWESYPYILGKYQTYAMAKAAVSHNGTMLQYVPRKQKFINHGELCRIALMQTDKAAPYVPVYFKFNFVVDNISK